MINEYFLFYCHLDIFNMFQTLAVTIFVYALYCSSLARADMAIRVTWNDKMFHPQICVCCPRSEINHLSKEVCLFLAGGGFWGPHVWDTCAWWINPHLHHGFWSQTSLDPHAIICWILILSLFFLFKTRIVKKHLVRGIIANFK